MARASFVVCRFSAADDGWRFLNADAGVRNSDTRFSARGEARLSALPPGSGLNFPPNFWHIVSSQRLGENAAAFRNGEATVRLRFETVFLALVWGAVILLVVLFPHIVNR